MPNFVDLIIVVNDFSTDKTSLVVKDCIDSDICPKTTSFNKREYIYNNDPQYKAENIINKLREQQHENITPYAEYTNKNSKIILVEHLENGGKGAAVSTGFKITRELGIDCTAIMDGDGQMDPNELEPLCLPIVNNTADYSKGNRLRHRSANILIPKTRLFGNSMLSILTKIASGYWRVTDAQTGYVAINLEALEALEIDKLYKRYGVYNDLLVQLNILSFRVTEITIKPIYGVGEESKMKIHKVIPRMSWLLVKLFFERLFKKYLLRDFHPVFLLYFLSFLSFTISLGTGIRFLDYYIHDQMAHGWLNLTLTMGLFSFQSLIFAMWFDMQDNERLYV